MTVDLYRDAACEEALTLTFARDAVASLPTQRVRYYKGKGGACLSMERRDESDGSSTLDVEVSSGHHAVMRSVRNTAQADECRKMYSHDGALAGGVYECDAPAPTKRGELLRYEDAECASAAATQPHDAIAGAEAGYVALPGGGCAKVERRGGGSWLLDPEVMCVTLPGRNTVCLREASNEGRFAACVRRPEVQAALRATDEAEVRMDCGAPVVH